MGHIFQDEEPPPRGWWQELTQSVQLSFIQRVTMFAIFLVVGLLLLGLSTWSVLSPTRFAKYYTFGSLFVTTGSMFLVGPIRQLRAITADRSRSVAAVAYVASIGLTLWAALYVQSVALATIFVVAQFVSAVWYGASFIPFAQSCLVSTTRAILPL